MSSAQTPPKPAPPAPFRATWKVPLNASLSAPPVFSGDRGFFPLDNGRLEAHDLATGDTVWSVDARVASQPAAGGGQVFFVEPDAIRAARGDDGSLAWQLPFSEPLASPLVWDNGWLVAASASGSILAFRASDGRLIWRHDVGSPPSARPALAADRVYIAAGDARIVALQVETGAPLWERRLGGAPSDMLALDDRVYIGSNDNFLYCLRASDGEIDWRWRTGGDVVGLPIVDDQRVYFVALDNLLRALDRRSGAQRWKRALPFRPRAGPVRVGDALVVSGVAPTLRAFLARDGTPAGEVATESEVASAPYALASAATPTFVVVTRSLAAGATLTAISRVSEPLPTPGAPAPTAPPAGDIR